MEISLSGEMLHLDSFPAIQSIANQLGVAGVVFTKNDGSMRIVAEAEEKILLKFARKIKKMEIFTRNAHMHVAISNPVVLGNFFIAADED